ncbi:alpha/beta hydrolase [Marmoricola endophyticus]|uniref:Alpha/beta hydrolase n=1 Tax=Marmoricola endophyticus TaxID=2040280 RepID=A0A917BGA6_9ACTN|nr:alpha/beta fold hydrolase [Marmoricola endophyticus]GGF41099.1 alpha/beta hydrolase [Marmoricola endophyticus]
MTTQRLTSYSHDGLQFAVRDEGPVDGPVVVLLHGFPQTSSCWDGVVPLLHEAGYRTVAPDQRGYSPGARPRGRSSYTLGRLVGDTVALVDQLASGPVHLVGHDWGAAVAWSTAAAHPEAVRTLTTVSVPHPQAFVRALKTPGQLAKSWYMGFFQLPWLPERAMASASISRRMLRGIGMDRESLRRYQREIVDAGALYGGICWYRALPLENPRGLGRPVTVPTTFVWSDDDGALGRTGADLTAEYVDAATYRFEVLEGVSHWIPEQAPERLAEIILDRVR